MQQSTLGAVAIQADAEALGELKRPLWKRGDVVRLESLDLFFVRVFLEAGFVAEEGEIFFVREQVERGERVVGRLVRSRLVLVEILLVRGKISWWRG